MKLSKMMDLEIRHLMTYLTLNIFIYAFFLAISNSAFGNKLWNFFVNLALGSGSKYEGDEIFDVDELVENEKRQVSDIMGKNERKNTVYILIGFMSRLLLPDVVSQRLMLSQ